jgi:alpha-L-rhamnosidase
MASTWSHYVDVATGIVRLMKPLLVCAALCLLLNACGGDGSTTPETPGGGPSTIAPAAREGLRVDLLRGDDVTIQGIEPRFSWAAPAADRSMQSAYRIFVGSGDSVTPDTADVWDSGVVQSGSAQGVRYGGRALLAGRKYRWRVQVWDESATGSPLSQTQAFAVGDPQSTLPPRLALTSQIIQPASLVETAPGHLFVAFPATAYGTLILEFPSAHAPGVFDVVLGDHRVGNAVWRSAADGFTDEISLVSHAAQISSPGTVGRVRLQLPVRVVAGAAPLPDGLTDVLPFRYAEISGDAATLRSIHVLQQAVSYPFDEGASAFDSSDAVLNDVWRMSRYTMKATSAFGLYIDGNRERLPYEADAYINQLGHYSVDSEYSLARYTNAYLLRNPSWPTEWVLHTHLMAWADFEYTGDDAFLQANYDQLARFALQPLERADGLISTRTGLVTPAYMASLGMTLGPIDIVDWPPLERDGYDMNVEYNTVVNLFHLRSLQIMASIATQLGRDTEAAAFRARAEDARTSILARLFDSQRGVFIDGEGSSHASLHANMFALAFDVVPADRRASVLAFVRDKGMRSSVYGAQYLLEGLYRSGEDAYALSLLTARDQRSWAHMIYDLGATIAHEAWDPSVKPNEDWNHAWGAAPANIIPRWLMGVRPLDPGFARFLVAPRLGSLQWAELRQATPRGTVTVRVEQAADGKKTIKLVVPGNSRAIVELPCRNGIIEASVDAVRVELPLANPDLRLNPLNPGPHEVVCR